ncbi:DNA/RNA non-specific endonuclease [Lachnoclostridium sp. MSJ-17]|uniref:DNA/RNA non-specific endonuclease n=1 Tax=Lachnoclostridium sp. MSJ-17 TaxID=2841516 RepID=UPI001C0F65EB|nr:DNA/RNA non-specific endonuclease [Lachnoclostridium sp. MSJ-17]MBU5463002.1 DNA/RNA non-specific endonuclease [Lachnoclostridium sp. MSJ-17]
MNKQNNKVIVVALCIIGILALFCRSDSNKEPIAFEQSSSTTSVAVDNLSTTEQTQPTTNASNNQPFDLSEIPSYSGNPYYEINDNQPFFKADELTTDTFKEFSELDSLGRCGVAFACLGTDSLPTEERGEIGMIKPTGWHTVRYDDIIEDKYLYNRCHLIAFELSGENANPKNLITGTRYMNVKGMLPFENRVRNYIENTNQHVMYRITPVFEGNNLVATGVLMESYSVEDDGEGICFNVFCYNVQPQIKINYADGTNEVVSTPESEEITVISNEEPNTTYVLNTNTKKFHYPDCDSVNKMKEKNKELFTGSRDEVISMGYSPCGKCNP